MIDRLSALLRLVCLVLAPMSALFLGPAVHGQGTMGQLPDPMSSEELQTHLGRYLDFDVDQALRIGPMHEEYLIEFKALRDGRITAWLEDARELQGTSQIPDVRALRRFVGEQESILASIRKIDLPNFEERCGDPKQPNDYSFRWELSETSRRPKLERIGTHPLDAAATLPPAPDPKRERRSSPGEAGPCERSGVIRRRRHGHFEPAHPDTDGA